MFSTSTVALIKATVPLLRERGEDITRHFYASMLAEHPELKAFFNEAHQAHGTQARALAGAVLAYATHIDQLDAIAPALPRIIQKHAALGVLPEHYPIVGQCLLRAIRTVLGEVATDAVLDAWAQAYGALAQLLIDAEEQVYAANAAASGGWRGERRLRLIRKEAESDIITSFYFASADGSPLMDYQPGQYLTLVLHIDGRDVRRNYSLSDAPGRGWYRISVKREVGGRVSNWLHDHLAVGDDVRALPPCGDFLLDVESPRPLVLVTAGVGVTPAMSMLEAVAASGRPVHFIHAAQHSGVHAFRSRVDALAQAHPNVQPTYLYDQPRPECAPHRVGRLSTELLAELLPQDRNVDLYFLGPKPFMQQVLASARALEIPAGQVRYEFFGPLEDLAA
ncbi:NO-inducible flavohemoprotein [Roseateles terrae]|uniref:nitric oxide dioxygenase n=1 Tax=Roseateles terrae TaxID=431060 RepID=A0ABR6GN83_9BURK|nr:NO-inducible flavohemoprotein [Roseateles terrae]MBB3193577.1 nitric oxide dioxygenase [Roseateles terrae]OWQ89255.1 nitric oxide dioxygenase [Roseateles terrae]